VIPFFLIGEVEYLSSSELTKGVERISVDFAIDSAEIYVYRMVQK
jgi:hypothetical protein